MKRSAMASFIVLTMIIMVLPLSDTYLADPSGTDVIGTVVYSPYGTQIVFPNATVFAINNDNDSVSDWTTSAADGSYVLRVPNGTYRIGAYAEGYNSSNTHPELFVSGELVINLNDLSGRGPLLLQKVYSYVNGTVKSNGMPLVNASVSITHDGIILNSSLTDSSGIYNVQVQSGNHTLIVSAEGYAKYNITVNAPESRNITANVNMTPLSSYSLQGTVLIATMDKNPLANARVSLTRVSTLSSEQNTLQQTTNASGVFLFPTVLEGHYLMNVSRDGYGVVQNVHSEFNLTENTVLEFSVLMSEAFGSVSGTVRNGTFMISNARMTLIDSNGEVHGKPVSTDSDGFYQFTNVPTGTYTLKVTRNGYEYMEATVLVTSSENSVMKFDLPNIEHNYLFGVDMPHSMMLIGIFLASCLLVIAVGFRLQVDETPEMLYLKSLEEEEEEL